MLKGSGFGPVCIGKRNRSRDYHIGVTETFSEMGLTFIIYKQEVDVFMTGNRRLEGFSSWHQKVERRKNIITSH